MKAQKQILLAMLLFMAVATNAQVGIGTTKPSSSAVLDLSSTTKGLLPPRMTTTQRDSINSPAAGLVIFNTTTSNLEYYNGTAWVGAGIFSHYVGELYAGGIVVAVWKLSGVEHGIVASLTDVSAGSSWSNVTTTLIGPTAESLYDGMANSLAIIGQAGHTASGALLCVSYNGGGYTDWYLPAAWELNECYNAAMKVNAVLGLTDGFQFTTYLTSTEYNASYAYSKYFTSGTTFGLSKADVYRVRAVRRF